MKACGVIVEYNPFHNGHLYHIEKAREITQADCIVAVMSGPFLQRGEPAIIDKYHRAKAALLHGVDIVIELPYVYAVQSSKLFAEGALLSLQALGVDYVCFGSESGEIEPFIQSAKTITEKQDIFHTYVQSYLKKGLAYPVASQHAYEKIGLAQLDLYKPNNILGFSYVKTILEHDLRIQPMTIQRKQSNYHDEQLTTPIASATSIRKEIFKSHNYDQIDMTLPKESLKQCQRYEEKAGDLHQWEAYFPLLQYKVMTMSVDDLAEIHGVTEGIEHRIKKHMPQATSFAHLLQLIKTKRYTQTRLQRMFVHLLTNTRKEEVDSLVKAKSVPYIRLLGMNGPGRKYIHTHKKELHIPLYTNLHQGNQTSLYLDERATHAYYSILAPQKRIALRKQEFTAPIII